MRRLFLIILFAPTIALTGYSTFLSYSADGMTVPAKSCSCYDDDPIESSRAYSTITGEQLCVDSCKHRPVVPIANKNMRSDFKLGNILQGKDFYMGDIKLNQIENVYLVYEEFTEGIHHTAFLFRFKKAIKLHNQRASKSNDTLYATGLTLSPEGVPPQGQKYSMADGAMGSYTTVIRMMTEEHFTSYAQSKDHPLKLFVLNKDIFDPADLFRAGIEMSEEKSFRSVYQLLFNNCATMVTDLLLQSSGQLVSKGWDRHDIINWTRGLPVEGSFGTLVTLQAYNFLNSQKVIRK